MKGGPLFKTLGAALAKVKAKTVGKTLCDVEVEAPVDMLAETLEEAVAKATVDTIACDSRYYASLRLCGGKG